MEVVRTGSLYRRRAIPPGKHRDSRENLMKKTLTTLFVVVAVAGCANPPWNKQEQEPLPPIPKNPSKEWVFESLPAFKAAAQQNPTQTNIAKYKRVKAFSVDETHNERMTRLNRQLTMAYGNFGRAGAAERQPGYIHVLYEDFNTMRRQLNNMSMDTLADEMSVEIEGLSPEQAREAMEMIMRRQTPSGNMKWIESDSEVSYSLYELARWGRYCDQGREMDEDDWRFVSRELPNGMPDIFDSCQRPGHGYNDYLVAWERFCAEESTTIAQRDIVRDSVRPKSTAQSCPPLL